MLFLYLLPKVLLAGCFGILLQRLIALPLEHFEAISTSERETRIGYWKSTLEVDLLIGRLYGEYLVSIARAIDIIVGHLARKIETTNHLGGIIKQMLRVGLEVNPSV